MTTRWMSRRAGVVVTLIALALTGCAPTMSYPTRSPWPEDPIASSQNSATAPAAFRDRDVLEACADVLLEQGEPVPAKAAACVDAGFASGAELVVVGPTTEGDPIVTYYRVGPAIEGMEIFIDSTLDQWGFGWSHQLCAAATSFADVGECAEVE